MLDTETKRRIDTARDILVGKLPNPQSQVEQITIALIYKFMDDMDKEAIDLGGDPTFFTGDYEKYSWTKIFDPKLGGFEMLNLYGEAIVKLNQNPSIPQLFRDIFKNAYLPYRDPETLKLFLKTINEFTYDHSEKLGDAFEYLLSVLGSQGDAGQFRTPRHIIDFIVAIVQPKKGETILDPACGTAGFLISSYKHILSRNTNTNKGDQLTPDDRKKLMQNFVGYDISPDMVRLSLVNMYLHNFTTPKIYEYDTLTSEERWGDYFDVILANPPFMTPKGGIKPHKKFTMQANRSEVLFVDYISEHINPSTGRAGVIVPEGIIFQSATAYKALRKLIVDKQFLYAVVSLPAGIFQPYSGVKTTVLLFDKTIAKKTDKILFVKLENDGYSLGAQRKELATSDIPDAINFIREYQSAIKNDDYSNLDIDKLPLKSLLIDKSRIAETDDYNLSIDRYRVEMLRNTKYELISLSEICELIRGVTYSKDDEVTEDGLKILRANNIKLDSGQIDFSDVRQISKTIQLSEKQKLRAKDIFICIASGSADHIGKTAFVETDLDYYFGGFMGAIRCNELVLPEYLFQNLQGERFNTHLNNIIAGANIKNLKAEFLYSFKIPLPPISVQKEITLKIDQYDKIIRGAKQVVDTYKSEIDILSDWEMVELNEISESSQIGLVKNTSEQGLFSELYSHPYIKMDSISYNGELNLDKCVYVSATNEELEKFTLNNGDFIYNTRNTPELVGKSAVFHGPSGVYLFNNNIFKIKFKENANSDFINIYLNSITGKNTIRSLVSGTTSVAALYQKEFFKIKVPLPPIETQNSIIELIEKEQELVSANKKLMDIYGLKIKETINKLWQE